MSNIVQNHTFRMTHTSQLISHMNFLNSRNFLEESQNQAKRGTPVGEGDHTQQISVG